MYPIRSFRYRNIFIVSVRTSFTVHLGASLQVSLGLDR